MMRTDEPRGDDFVAAVEYPDMVVYADVLLYLFYLVPVDQDVSVNWNNPAVILMHQEGATLEQDLGWRRTH